MRLLITPCVAGEIGVSVVFDQNIDEDINGCLF
jgi:hypothetical protein